MLLSIACCLAAALQDPQPPRTVPEATAYAQTSRQADVLAFLAQLTALPHGERLTVTSMGKSHEGRDLTLVRAALPGRVPAADDLRLLVNANIHGGEVEGKEAVQAILRELALGEHAELLAHATLYFVPLYNVDGNERIERRNRSSQNGPDGGVGERPNAQELDLNRDFVKAESPECRALLKVIRDVDPHLFLDLHTTNGTAHGYHLTYAPSLSTNVDPGLDAFARDALLPEVTAALARAGLRAQHYGNASGREQRQWVTYDHRPRFGTNYYGLRNRLGVLSEAFSYASFEQRIEVTRAFTLEVLGSCVRRRAQLVELCAGADARLVAQPGAVTFGHDSELVAGTAMTILMGEVERVELEGGLVRRVALPTTRAEEMLVRVAFESGAREPLPAGWLLRAEDAGPEVLAAIRRHGVWVARTTAAADLEVGVFDVSAVHRASRPFQGHAEVRLEGTWRAATMALPAGTLFVPARQPLARLAAQLLEPESEDSLSTWNVFDAATTDAEGERPGRYPVLRLRDGAAAVAAEDLPPFSDD
jgi:hypothetical protein